MNLELFSVKHGEKKSVIRKSFNDLEDLTKFLKKAKTSKQFSKEECSSQRKVDLEEDDEFHDFSTYEEALNALEFGTDKYFDNFNANLKRVSKFLQEKELKKRISYENNMVGFAPIVPNTIIGNPVNMVNQKTNYKKIPTAKIVLEKGNSCGVNSADMCLFYSMIFALIQNLEQKGTRCEVWVCETAREGEEITCFNIKIKNYNQPINMYKIQFPIIATDFFRRILFRLLEVSDELKENWTWGYGHPLLTDCRLL